MKRFVFFLLTSLAFAHSQDVVPTPMQDYKTLYEMAVQRVKEANAVAVQWKEKAEKAEVEKQKTLAALADQKVINNVLRKQSVALGTEPTALPKKDTVAEGIRVKAEQEWPNDYSMQKYIIEKETAAFRSLQANP